MTTNFTLRDFFVYLLTGLILILSVGFVFQNEIFNLSLKFFNKYDFLNEFSFLVTIFLIPVIYILGHLIGSINYNLLKVYVWIHPRLKQSGTKNHRLKLKVLQILQKMLYRQRVVYKIIKIYNPSPNNNPIDKVEEFWTICASLQVGKIYAHAEYWYVLNELFNSINLIFFISAFLSILHGQWALVFVFFLLTILAFNRAKQYSEHFVKTVIRLSKVMSDLE